MDEQTYKVLGNCGAVNIAFGVIYLHDEDAAATEAALRGRKPHGNITRGLYYRGI